MGTALFDPTVRSRSALHDLLRRIRYFAELSPEVLDALAADAIRLRYAAGETIFLEGEPTAGLFVVEEGIVKIIRISLEGREHIINLSEPGDTFNDVSALDGGPNPAHAIARSNAVLWRISRTDLQRLAQGYPELAWALIEDLAARTRSMVALVHDLAMRSVRGRLARLLLEQAEDHETDIVERLLTQEEMASRLGTVREMVGRTLRSMAADGIIEFDRHRIVILDPDRLAQEAEV